jgi:hypothetical protein
MAKEMNDIMQWYSSEGLNTKDLSKASKADVEKFKKAQGLMTMWGYKINPTPEQLKEIADSLIFFRRNNYKPEIFDQYEGEEGAKLKRLQQAMVDWRLESAESSELLADEGEAMAKEIEGAFDWWRDNGKNFNPKTALPEHLFIAEKIKAFVDSWKPRGAQQNFTWKRSQKAAKEVSEAIDLWRDNGKTFGVESLKVSHKDRANLIKLHDSMLEWRRNSATNISEAEAEQTVKDMINAMNWWKKKGKDYDPIKERLDAVPALFQWMRGKSKEMDVDDVDDARADQMKTLFQSWGAKKNQKPKAVAKEIEDALSWWRNKKFSVDSKGLGPSDEAKMTKLESLIQKWADVKASNESPSDLH